MLDTDTWNDTCPTCGGSKKTRCTCGVCQGWITQVDKPTGDDRYQPCPTCEAITGRIMLTVECEAPSKSVHKRWLAQGCGERPLTRGEVGELQDNPILGKDLINLVERGLVTYKGQPVHLRPWRGE